MKNKLLDATKLSLPVIVLISVSYEFFFFLGMGSSLSQSPLVTADFLRGWIEWSPSFIIFVIGYFATRALSLQTNRIKDDTLTHATENNEITKPYRLKQIKKRLSLSDVCFVVSGLLFFHFLLNGERTNNLLGSCLLMLACGAIDLLFRSSIAQENQLILASGILILGFVLFFAGYGFHRGSSVIDKRNFDIYNTSTLQMKLDDQTVNVVRIFDQWALVKRTAGNFAWINHQSGKLIEFESHRVRFKGILCYFFDYRCYKDN
jgi:hypothetical protein